MIRWAFAIFLFSLCGIFVWLYLSGGEETADQAVFEKRIVLLDRTGLEAGRSLKDGKPVQKRFRILGREKRPYFSLQPGETVAFDALPVHARARLCIWLGSEAEGESAVSVSIRSDDNKVTAENVLHATFKEPGWQSCTWTLEPDFDGKNIQLTFTSSGSGTGERIIADPVLLSQGKAVAVRDIAPLRIEDSVADLLNDFDSARQVRSDTDRPLAKTIWRLDPVKRTVADDAKKVIRAAPDSEFVFTMDVPASAFLDVASVILPVGDPRTATDPGHVEFKVFIDGKCCATIGSDYINGVNDKTAFINVYEKLICWERIDLSPWAGRQVDLSFQTAKKNGSPPEGTEYAWWDLRVRKQLKLPRSKASAANPNVLVLCVDALRADHLGCYGYPRETSENLDRLAERSLLFENAISPCSWTLPATASLLTGLHPNTHGVLGNTRNYLVDGITTVAEFLGIQGLSTAAFTANALVCAAINFDQGFERFVEVHDANADRLNDDLIAWIESCGSNQFFAYVHYMEPHSPYSAPGRYRQQFDPDYVEQRDFSGPLPEWWRLGKVDTQFTPEQSRHLVNLYDSEIYFWDLEFKRLLQALDTLSLRDRTLIIITSDHGEEFFDHEGLGHGITLYQEVVHVPLILFDPRLKQGERITGYVNNASLFNTITDRLGLKAPGFVQIKSLYPLDRIESRFDAIYSATERNQEDCTERWASVIVPPYKRITGLLGAGEMLFNLSDDPREMKNLLTEQPDLAEVLKRQVIDWVDSTSEAFPDEWQPVTPEILQKLREFGYIGGE